MNQWTPMSLAGRVNRQALISLAGRADRRSQMSLAGRVNRQAPMCLPRRVRRRAPTRLMWLVSQPAQSILAVLLNPAAALSLARVMNPLLMRFPARSSPTPQVSPLTRRVQRVPRKALQLGLQVPEQPPVVRAKNPAVVAQAVERRPRPPDGWAHPLDSTAGLTAGLT
jgi:hypothetical protein